ncbi:MAG: DUF169 domain-containing protein [Candidatus Omnitrophica bacterium]|nr:DUF169 domain-containing protein [Candidatus Omnitrophota bacterium]
MKDIIGISFKENKPVGISRLDYKDKHCHFIGKARNKSAFYISKEDIDCPLARFYLGIESSKLQKLSRILVGWSDAVNKKVGLDYLRSAVRIKESKEHIIYFPYPYKDIEPDVVIKIANAQEIQEIIQKFSSITGERIKASLSGIGAACGECTALPLITKKPNVSVGCYGSRPGINLKKEELLLAMPFNSKMVEILSEFD